MSQINIDIFIFYTLVIILAAIIWLGLALRGKYYYYEDLHGNLLDKFLAHPVTSFLLSYCPRFVRRYPKLSIKILRTLLGGLAIYMIFRLLITVYYLLKLWFAIWGYLPM